MNTYYFSVQRQLPGQFTLDVGYVGNNANNLIIINDLNQARPNAIGENTNVENRRPNLAFSSIATTLPYGYSNYNSLQVKLEKRSSNGLYFLNSFTWSKALDIASQAFDNSNGNCTAVQDINNVNADYGISNYNRPINNITSLTYQLPVGRGRRFLANAPRLLDLALGGWDINPIVNARSGEPVSLSYTPDAQHQVVPVISVLGRNAYRPNVNGSPTLPDATRSPRKYLNSANVTVPLYYAPFGNSRRNTFRGYAYYTADLGISKNLPSPSTLTFSFAVRRSISSTTPTSPLPMEIFKLHPWSHHEHVCSKAASICPEGTVLMTNPALRVNTPCTILLLAVLGVVAASAQSGVASAPLPLPILFVHGNGDDAARWIPTTWLFESNGYPADRLFAIRFTNPAARADDTREEAFRSSTTDAAAELAANVTRVLIQTHSHQVILVGSSRGGLTIRNYLQNGAGAPVVAVAILCGTPNHGVVANDLNPGGEFNGKGAFLSALNRPSVDGSETVAGVRMLTLRSDTQDKYAQPTGIASGHPENTTGITYDGPALRGATNLVLPGEDHREVAFSRPAFEKMFDFITGHPPQTLEVVAEPHPSVSGIVTGYEGLVPTNQPLANIHLRIYPTSTIPSGPVYETTTSVDGRWGPFTPLPHTEYEFDLEGLDRTPAAAIRHIRYFIADLPRSSNVWNLRFLPMSKEPAAGGMLLVSRQRGYFSRERDPVLIDGQPSQEEPAGLPIRDSFVIHTPRPNAMANVTLRKETIKVAPSADLSKDMPIAYFLW